MSQNTTKTPYAIERKLKYFAILNDIVSGKSTEEACKAHGVVVRTWQRMKNDYAEETTALMTIQMTQISDMMKVITEGRIKAINIMISSLDNEELPVGNVISIEKRLKGIGDEVALYASAIMAEKEKEDPAKNTGGDDDADDMFGGIDLQDD